jgi:L-threonylcarbamoyladenylate synthase
MSGRVVAATMEDIARAAAMLRAGELVAFPTETVYGLGGDSESDEAVSRIFAAKGRPADHPVIVHIAGTDDLAYWARDVSADAARLAKAFWPGPLTLILPRTDRATDVVTGGQDSVGLRVPSHPVARDLLHAFAAAGGHGVAAPSANRFGRISPTTARHVDDDLGDRVALILDGGACAVGIESTIVAFADGEPVLLRPGGIGAQAIARVLGRAPRAGAVNAPRASGTLASHYAPRTASRLVAAGALVDEARREAGPVAVLARTVVQPGDHRGAWIAASPDAAAYAHDLYSHLRALDVANARTILIEAVPDDAAWAAVRDRLVRATHGDDDDRD